MHLRKPTAPSLSLILRVTMASILSLSLLLLYSLSSISPSASGSHRPHFHPNANSLSIPQACKATRFPQTCESTLNRNSSLNPTLSDLIVSNLAASAANVDVAQKTANAILDASKGNPNRTNAAKNCIELLSFSSKRLFQASEAVRGANLDDARAWTSAALQYQYDCFSGLKYVNGTKQVDAAMWYLIELFDITSNALSLLLAYRRFGDDVEAWRPPQTERDGYWGEARVGRAFTGSFIAALPENLTPNARVCGGKDGICYGSVQDAVDAAPDFGRNPFVIHIEAGVYDEIVNVPFEKTNVVFLGDGIGKTVITGNRSSQMVGVTTYNTGTVTVVGDRFMARDITFQNTAGPEQHQAVAFRSDSDLSVIENVEFWGHQDTLYAHSHRQFYRSCRIVGTVDFVFGNSAAIFEGCTLLVQPRPQNPEKGETNAFTAQGRVDPAQASGFVFRNCTLSGTPEYMALYNEKPDKHKNYLGRPWKEYSRVVFLNSYIGEIVRPEGWLPWSGDFALATLFYGEFGNSGPGGNVSGRVKWSSQVPEEHVGAYSVQNFIQGGYWVPPGSSLLA